MIFPRSFHRSYLAAGIALLPFVLLRGGGPLDAEAGPGHAVDAPAEETLESVGTVESVETVETAETVETVETVEAVEPSHRLNPGLRPLRAARGAGEVGGLNGADGTDGFHLDRAPIPVRVGTEVLPHRISAVPVLPGGTLSIRAVGEVAGRPVGSDPPELFLEHAAGRVVSAGTGAWEWTAPTEPGIHALRIRSIDRTGIEPSGSGRSGIEPSAIGPSGIEPTGADRSGPDGIDVWIHALVLNPRSEVRGGELEGYAIGRYVERPRRGLEAYVPPEGFVRVDRDVRDVLVSPHFTLGQFLCKQPGEPRFVAYSLPLVLKLEAVLEALDQEGHSVPTLHVMSGFRTPAYNRAIGNTTVYSRHLWGDAADVWVDGDGDGEMDDLNGDGRTDLADARFLGEIVDRVESRGGVGIRPGGMGLYRRNAHHGPFVHVDARGYRSRW